MKEFTLRHLADIGIISTKLKQCLILQGCFTSFDMEKLSRDRIKVSYLEKFYKLKDELFQALKDIEELESLIPERQVKVQQTNSNIVSSHIKKKKFKVGDYTEELLKQSNEPIHQTDLVEAIKKYLPDTYLASIRANLNGDPLGRFVFFLDGYIGLKIKKYDNRFQIYTTANKKKQYAEQRIMEFLKFIEDKHRSPQPHGLEEEESLYRWFLDFTKSTSKEMATLRNTFKEYLKEYEEWVFTPYEYNYKRYCDQMKWYVDENLELPSQDNEPELSSWFYFQLDYHNRYNDKRKQMFDDLIDYLADYGIHFYDAKSSIGKTIMNEDENLSKNKVHEETPLDRYKNLSATMFSLKKSKNNAKPKSLLLLTIGNLIHDNKMESNVIFLNKDLLTEFANVCIEMVGTASSCNIAIPFYYLKEEPFWELIPKEGKNFDEVENIINPTYEIIEQSFSCAILDRGLYDLLLDNDSYLDLRQFLTDLVLKDNETFIQ